MEVSRQTRDEYDENMTEEEVEICSSERYSKRESPLVEDDRVFRRRV
jgi:hypothetical protein